MRQTVLSAREQEVMSGSGIERFTNHQPRLGPGVRPIEAGDPRPHVEVAREGNVREMERVCAAPDVGAGCADSERGAVVRRLTWGPDRADIAAGPPRWQRWSDRRDAEIVKR